MNTTLLEDVLARHREAQAKEQADFNKLDRAINAVLGELPEPKGYFWQQDRSYTGDYDDTGEWGTPLTGVLVRR